MKIFLFTLLFFFHLFSQNPREVKLALSGGGARGFAHLGVLKALADYDIKITEISGSSAGAFIGALYASDYTLDEIFEIIKEFSEADNIFFDYSRKDIPIVKKINTLNPFVEVGIKNFYIDIPKSLAEDSRLNFILIKFLSEASLNAKNDFSKLKVPLRIIASDIFDEKEKEHAFYSGDLARTVRASISIPTVLPPVKIDGHLYVDGGLFNNLPSSYYKEEDFVIAVNTASEVIETPEEIESVLDMSVHMINVLASKSDSNSVSNWDIFIEPDIANYNSTDYQNYKAIVDSGYSKASSILEAKGYVKQPRNIELKKNESNQRLDFEKFQIGKISVKGDYRLTKLLISRNMEMEKNDYFSWEKLHNGMNRLFAQKYINFFWVSFEIIDNKLNLNIEIEENNLTRLGVGGYYLNSVGNNIFIDLNFIGRLGNAEVITLQSYLGNYKNGFRAGFRNNSLFKGPIYDYFHVSYFSNSPKAFDKNSSENNQFDVGYKTGVFFNSKTMLLSELSYRIAESETNIVGEDDTDKLTKFNNLALSFSFITENLDNKFFPTKGTSTNFKYTFNYAKVLRENDEEELYSFNRFSFEIENHQSIWDKSFILSQNYKFVSTINEGTSLIPYYEKVRLDLTRGSFGYYDDSMYGLHMAKSVFTLKTRLIQSLYLYSSYGLLTGWEKLEDIEFSTLKWEDINDGYEVGFYYSSYLGPILLTYSSDEYFQNALRFSIGYIF